MTTFMVPFHSSRFPDCCNVCPMGILPLGVLVRSHRGCASGSGVCLHYTARNCKHRRDHPDWYEFSAYSSSHPSRASTVALILFNFAVTSGPTDGWASAAVLVPLIISIMMVIGFFYWETRIHVDKAAIPPRTWFYPNFSILFAVALLPFFWLFTVFLIFTTLWQNVFEWSAISSAVHMLSIGVAAFIMSFTGSLSRIFSPKWIILTGLSFCMVATVLMALGGGKPEDYWPYIFPAFSLGSAGIMLTYTHTNIAIFQAAPSSMAGTVGAIFNGALLFGSAIGLAVISSIETSVEANHGGSHEYKGRAAVFWFLLAVISILFISVSIFYDRSTDHTPQPEHGDPGHPARRSMDSDTKLDDANVTMIKKADLVNLPA
ncbi:major facilitator superfamily domain-containing protein [Suillus tomentosus]|nr:major facilitator superfamily domain-containing protein [Suillus tomentosus]